MNFSATMTAAKLFLRHHKSAILTGIGAVLTIAAVCEAVRATSKAKDVIDELEYEKFEEMGAPEEPNVDFHLDRSEVLKGVWKCYILTFLLTGGALTCVICSHVNSNKTIGAMSMAYASLLETYNTYKDNVRKNISEKEQRAITHGTVHDIIEKDQSILNEKSKSAVMMLSDETKVLFRDAYSSKGTGYFRMNMNDARIAVSKFNKWMMNNEQASLNDWYDFLGLGHSELGDYMIWKWEDGPVYLKAIPDDIDMDEDINVTTALGLVHDECDTFFSIPQIIRP